MSSEWIVWNDDHGCPVEKGVLVDVQYSDGDEGYAIPALTPCDFKSRDGCECSAEYWGSIRAWRLHVTDPTPRIAAHEFLERGVKHMSDRAVQRDSDAGERSMARAVAAFNAQEGTNLTEAQGWRFMIQLKYARAVNGVFVADDYEDGASYFGLAGEAAQ